MSPFLALTSCYHTACSTALRPQGECDSLIFAAIWRNIHRGVLLCVSLCDCILNCPRQATREWRPEGLVPVENVRGRWAAVQKHSGSISCKLGSELPRRVLPDSGLFCETLICRIRAALPAALWTPCCKPSTEIQLFGCCYGNGTIMAKLEWRWGAEKKVD